MRLRSRPDMSIRAEVSSGEESDDDFEARLAKVRKGGDKKKEKTPYEQLQENKKNASSAPKIDYSNETVYFESAPHRGDLAINVALGATLLWLPLTIAALGRGIFVKYRFTDKRISVITSAPWKNEQLDAAYQQVKSVQSIGRGIGFWGDMVVELTNGDKIEMRALPKHKEIERYIKDQAIAAGSKTAGGKTAGGSDSSKEASKGFSR